MNSCITQIARELYEELFQPTDLSVPVIGYWLRANLGQLNNRLCKGFDLDCDLNVTPDLSLGEANIFKTMFVIYYYNKKTISSLGDACVDVVIEVESDGSRVRKYNKNELAKTWISMRTAATDDLKNLINGYKFCSAANAIGAVVGADALYNSYCCCWKTLARNYYSP